MPGDIINLKEGDQVPADVRILTTVAFNVEEAILTGTKDALPPSLPPSCPPSRPPALVHSLVPFLSFSSPVTGESVAVSKVVGPMNAG